VNLQNIYDAVRSLLAVGVLANGIPNPTDKRVSDSVRVNGSTPIRDNYVVLSDESPLLEENRYTALERSDSRARHRFDVRSVATSPGARRLFQQTARDNLIGAVPVVEGRVCTPVQPVAPVEEGRPQHDTTANLFHVTDSFEFWSWPV
jgi:hypothetical protein